MVLNKQSHIQIKYNSAIALASITSLAYSPLPFSTADTHDFTFLEDWEDTHTDVPEHTWLLQWYAITSSSPIYPTAVACRVSTPLSLLGWHIMYMAIQTGIWYICF